MTVHSAQQFSRRTRSGDTKEAVARVQAHLAKRAMGAHGKHILAGCANGAAMHSNQSPPLTKESTCIIMEMR